MLFTRSTRPCSRRPPADAYLTGSAVRDYLDVTLFEHSRIALE